MSVIFAFWKELGQVTLQNPTILNCYCSQSIENASPKRPEGTFVFLQLLLLPMSGYYCTDTIVRFLSVFGSFPQSCHQFLTQFLGSFFVLICAISLVFCFTGLLYHKKYVSARYKLLLLCSWGAYSKSTLFWLASR